LSGSRTNPFINLAKHGTGCAPAPDRPRHGKEGGRASAFRSSISARAQDVAPRTPVMRWQNAGLRKCITFACAYRKFPLTVTTCGVIVWPCAKATRGGQGGEPRRRGSIGRGDSTPRTEFTPSTFPSKTRCAPGGHIGSTARHCGLSSWGVA
jgi:hypothetical protein